VGDDSVAVVRVRSPMCLSTTLNVALGG